MNLTMMSWRLPFPLLSAAAIMSNGTTSSSMSSSKSCSRCIRAKLCNTAVAILMTRVFAKAVCSPKCRHGKHRLSNLKHLNNTPSTLRCSILVHLSSTLWQICSASVSPVTHKNTIKSTVPACDLGDDRQGRQDG